MITICEEFSCLYKYSKEANEQGLKLFLRAVEIDPRFCRGPSHKLLIAMCSEKQTVGASIANLMPSKPGSSQGKRWSRPKDDPIVLAKLGHGACLRSQGHLEEGAAYLKKATNLARKLGVRFGLTEDWYRFILAKPGLLNIFIKPFASAR